MAKNNNLTDFLTDVADAIRDKKGTTEKINPQDFSDEIRGIKTSTSMWTGHVDVEGLKAIGWDDDDIAYFQEHGVNWMAEDDEYYKVSDDNKALYGVLTASNIQQYKDRIVWLPKIDGEFTGYIEARFMDSVNLKGIPKLNIHDVTNGRRLFSGCRELTCLPPLDLSGATSANEFARYCHNLQYVSNINLNNTGGAFSYAFQFCLRLSYIPSLDISNMTENVAAFSNCDSLIRVDGVLDVQRCTKVTIDSYSLTYFSVKNLKVNAKVSNCFLIHKSSLLYMIEHEAATEAITITLNAYAYARLATDPDIVAALNNHPLVSLASA